MDRPRPAGQRRHPLRAAPHDQLRLLDLQALDTRLDQLAHRRATLPEHAELERSGRRLRELRDLLVASDTEHGDVERARAKAEADVEQVRARARRNQQRLDSGQVGAARDLEALQSELASLARRQGDLEDVELEVMERLEGIAARREELVTTREEVAEGHAAAEARRDATLEEIDAEASTTATLRGVLAGQVDAALVAVYEKIRAQQAGIGAAALLHRRCQGCRLELDRTEINRLRDAEPDEVTRCPECGRVLVRTPESGL